MFSQEKPHYKLVPPFIFVYPNVLKLLLLMKCYKHISFKKKVFKLWLDDGTTEK